MAEGKKGVVLYADLIHQLEKMPNEKAGELFKTILRYVNDLNPEVNDLMVDLVFEGVKQQLKRDLRKYEERADRSRENGRKGGRPRKTDEDNKKPTETQQVFSEPRKPDIDKVIDKDKDKVIDKDILYYYDKDNLQLTIEQYRKLCLDYPVTTVDEFLGKVVNWKKKDSVKSLYLTILNWMRRDKVQTLKEYNSNPIQPKEEKRIPTPTSNPQSGQFC